MGYKNEYASLNKFSGMKKYFDKKIKNDILPIMKKTQKKERESQETPVKFTYKPTPNDLPCVGFDGGMATLFVGEPSETKLLKVSAGFSEENAELFNHDYQDDNIHIFNGKFKWLEGLDLTLEGVISELVDVMSENSTIKEALVILQIDPVEFHNNMYNKIFKFKGKGVEDNIREIFELSAIVVYNEKMKKNQKLLDFQKENNKPIPFLIIKDGTLYPSAKTVSSLFEKAISDYFNDKDNNIIGVVKSSRFVNHDNSWSRLVLKYAESLPSNSVYRIPDKLEMSIDPHSKNYDFRRYFLSLNGGESVYEIQISRAITDDEQRAKDILDVLSSQITARYGGSIVTNSYAHEQASLSEAEANFLTKEAKDELQQIINEAEKK